MLQQRVINKRAFAPKTRNGCLTCKTRRIKCDETQPRCQPCTRSLRQCHWKRPVQENAPRALIPITPRSSVYSQPPELLLAPTIAIQFQDPRDAQYFRTYKEQVSFELADAQRLSPFVEPVLRACHTSPFILHTVVALGALNKSMKMAHFAKLGSEAMKPITLESARFHKAYALSSYAKAISGMRATSFGPSTPTAVRHLLLAGLLVHCMESFLDSPKQAFQHSQAGYKLLLNWISSNPSSAASYRGLASPNTAILEDEIYQEYTRLDADNALSTDVSPKTAQSQFFTHNTKALSSMPPIFSTLEEAQSYEELFVQQSSHLISQVYATIRISHAHINDPQTLDFPGHIIDPINLPSITHLLPKRNEYLTQLTTWLTSFAPFLSQSSSSSNPYISVGSAILQGRMLDTFITLSSLFTPITSTDIYFFTHQQIISLILGSIKAATPHVEAVLVPVFQSCTSFHHPLNNLFQNCRDAAIRQQMFAMLIVNTPRDGEMDRRRWVHRSLFLAALEEANRLPDGDRGAGGIVSEKYRYHIVSHQAQYDEQKRETIYAVVCGRRDGWRGEGIGAWKFRFRTFGEEEWRDLVVGEVVGDDDLEGLRRERKREIGKWPKGMRMPRGLAWELLGWEIKERGMKRTTHDR